MTKNFKINDLVICNNPKLGHRYLGTWKIVNIEYHGENPDNVQLLISKVKEDNKTTASGKIIRWVSARDFRASGPKGR